MASSADISRIASMDGHWFHSIELAPGIWSKGHKSPATIARELEAWQFPTDLSGATVLDIGCADGAFSVEALRRGAREVLSIDEQMTTGMKMLIEHEVIPGLQFRLVNLFSNEFNELPKFDFVIFAGVLYHVQDMLEALKRVRQRAVNEVMIDTHVYGGLGEALPLALYYEHDELNNDPTNWWGPNVSCLEALFRTAGFDYRQTSLIWEDVTRANGRISYMLKATEGSVFGDITEGATGSNSLLEEARQRIAVLSAEVLRLQAELKTPQ